MIWSSRDKTLTGVVLVICLSSGFYAGTKYSKSRLVKCETAALELQIAEQASALQSAMVAKAVAESSLAKWKTKKLKVKVETKEVIKYVQSQAHTECSDQPVSDGLVDLLRKRASGDKDDTPLPSK